MNMQGTYIAMKVPESSIRTMQLASYIAKTISDSCLAGNFT